MKRMFALILCLVMALSMIPAAAAGDTENTGIMPEEITTIEPEAAAPGPDAEPQTEPSVVDSGTCGEGLTWTLYDDGLLQIDGDGNMTDYTSTGAPWYDYRNQIKSLHLDITVRHIGNCAFYACTNMTWSEQTHPSHTSLVTSIGDLAFFMCYKLDYLALGPNLRSVGKQAFSFCKGLKRVTVQSSPSFAIAAFSGCTGLEEISFVGGAPTFSSTTFKDCTATAWYPAYRDEWTSSLLQDYGGSITWTEGCHGWCGDDVCWDYDASNSRLTLSGSGETWDYTIIFAFPSFYSLHNDITSVKVNEGVTTLGKLIFCYLDRVHHIYLPDTLADIRSQAFEYVREMEELDIPASVTSLGYDIFNRCYNLEKIHFLGNAPTSIDSYAFGGLTATATYRSDKSGWTADVLRDYGGTITWVQIIVAPVITTQPKSASAYVGATAKFTVAATGAGLKYQWQYKYPDGSWKNSGYASGKTATLSFAAQAKYNKMQYRCKITDASGNSVTSSAVTLTILPKITVQPKSASATVGATVKFPITATGAGLTYQWQYKYPDGSWTNSGYASGKTAELSFAAQAKYNKMQYRCIITDANGKKLTSSAVTLTITPKITAQPKSTSATVGATAKFTVTATGAGLKYQWQYKYPDGSWTNSGYASGKTASLSFTAQAKYNNMLYRCKITDANGKTVTSSAVKLTIAPKITAQPKSVTAAAGATAKFTVTATGAGLKYQWQYKYPDGSWTNSGYSSAKTATLSVPVQAKYNGILYRCKVTDANGKTVTSNSAKLTVK